MIELLPSPEYKSDTNTVEEVKRLLALCARKNVEYLEIIYKVKGDPVEYNKHVLGSGVYSHK